MSQHSVEQLSGPGHVPTLKAMLLKEDLNLHSTPYQHLNSMPTPEQLTGCRWEGVVG